MFVFNTTKPLNKETFSTLIYVMKSKEKEKWDLTQKEGRRVTPSRKEEERVEKPFDKHYDDVDKS